MTTSFDEKALTRLASEIEKLNGHRFVRVHNSLWRMMAFQFARGLAFGLGSLFGATILVSLIGWWLAQFQFLPVIGEWAAQLEQYIEQAR